MVNIKKSDDDPKEEEEEDSDTAKIEQAVGLIEVNHHKEIMQSKIDNENLNPVTPN